MFRSMKRSPGLAWVRRAVLGAAVLLSLAAGLAAPAGALASTTYCVPSTSIAGCPGGSTPETTIKAALTAANADSSGGDTIRVGPGTYPEGALLDQKAAIIGAGQGQTTIQPPAASPLTTLDLSSSTATATGLTLDVASGANNTGLIDSGTATGVAIVAGVTSTPNAKGATVMNGTFASGSISVPSTGTGVYSGFIGAATVADSSITAGTGFSGAGTIKRTRITADVGVTVAGGTFGTVSVTIDDSLVQTVPGNGPEVGISASALGAFPPGNYTVTAHHDTLIGDGSPGSIGILCSAFSTTTSSSCQTTVDSSIIRGFAHTIVRTANSGPGANATATVGADYSDLDPTTDVDSNNNTAGGTASGQVTLGAHDVNVDPAFVDGTGAGAFAVTRQSTLIDAGDPVLGSGESTTDLAGLPRVVAGRLGAPAVSDIGAFEYQDRAPSVTASSSAPAAGVRVGALVTFTAAGATSDPGDSITGISWHFDDGGTASGTSVTHAFARAGKHSAVATVTDLNGYSVASVPVVVIVAAPVRPAITHLKLKPSAFAAARSGASVVAVSHDRVFGTVVSYRDSAPATTKFTVLRRKVLRGRTRWVTVGSFTRSGRAGANSFRFTGRVGRRRLARGKYRFSVSKAVFVSFRVVR
jgi:PKD domain